MPLLYCIKLESMRNIDPIKYETIKASLTNNKIKILIISKIYYKFIKDESANRLHRNDG